MYWTRLTGVFCKLKFLLHTLTLPLVWKNLCTHLLSDDKINVNDHKLATLQLNFTLFIWRTHFPCILTYLASLSFSISSKYEFKIWVVYFSQSYIECSCPDLSGCSWTVLTLRKPKCAVVKFAFQSDIMSQIFHYRSKTKYFSVHFYISGMHETATALAAGQHCAGVNFVN